MKKLSPERKKLDEHILEPEYATIKWDSDECCLCGNSPELETPYGTNRKDAIEQLFKMGWRQRSSSVFDMIGLMCPECIKTRNNKSVWL